MKKYSTNYPLIFGIVCLIVGFCVKQIPIILFFGVIPIVISLILKWSDHKAKKQGLETSTERDNRIYQDYQKRIKMEQTQKKCCARCGIDLSLIPNWKAKEIAGKRYCDVCQQIVLNAAKAPVWVDNHRFGQERETSFTPAKRPDISNEIKKQKALQIQRLICILNQLKEIQTEEIQAERCSDCGQQLSADNMIFVDGTYYCKECYKSIFEGMNRENSETKLCQISYELDGVNGRSLHDEIVEVVDRLLVGGFVFYKVCIGGGVNEISHVGAMAYGATYRNYEDFRINMESDIRKRELEEEKKSGGWINSLNYSNICAYLARNTLKVCVYAECGRIILRWFDTTKRAFAVTRIFAESLNEELYSNKGTIKQIDNAEYDEDYFSNWSS